MNRHRFAGGEPLIVKSACACHDGGDAGEVAYRPGEIHDLGDNPVFEAGGRPGFGPWTRVEPDPAEDAAEKPSAAPAAPPAQSPASAAASQPATATPAAASAPAPGTEGA